MPPIVTSAEIERPAAEVFAYATDPARFSEWQKGVVDGHMAGPADGIQPPAVGAKCVTTRRIGGANRPSTSELVHIDPPRTWGVRAQTGRCSSQTASRHRWRNSAAVQPRKWAAWSAESRPRPRQTLVRLGSLPGGRWRNGGPVTMVIREMTDMPG